METEQLCHMQSIPELVILEHITIDRFCANSLHVVIIRPQCRSFVVAIVTPCGVAKKSLTATDNQLNDSQTVQ